jgi:hypothetical protein
MKDFLLGFLVCFALCSSTYIVWEHSRHVAVLIKEAHIAAPVPVPDINV